MPDSTGDLKSPDSFPNTHWSLIDGARGEDEAVSRASWDTLCRLYWRPVYAYVRARWKKPEQESLDLTQGFFAAILEKNFLERVAPHRGRFRAFVKTAIANYLLDQHRHDSAAKRGGARVHVSLQDLSGVEIRQGEGPEDVFARECAEALLDEAVRRLEAEFKAAGKEKQFELFASVDLKALPDDNLRYESLATRFGITEHDVNNHIHRARKRLREIALRIVAETVSSPGDAEPELRELFGDPAP